MAFEGEEYLPVDLPADEEAGALSFALLVRSLINDARFALGEEGGARLRLLAEWLELMRGLLTSYLVPADDEEERLDAGYEQSGFRFDDTDGGTGELICLEVNTQAGMTATSLVPELAGYAGWSFGELVRWMVEDASCNRSA